MRFNRSVDFGLIFFGTGLSGLAVIFNTLILVVLIALPFGLFMLAYKTGGELSNTGGKLGLGLIGLLHAGMQLTLPVLVMRFGNWWSLAAIAIILTLAAVAAIVLSYVLPAAKDADWQFGLVVLIIWIVAAVLMRSAALSGAPDFYVDSVSRLIVGLLVAGVTGAILTCANFGWYLAVCLAFNGHNNEAGGAARIEQYKGIIRFCLNKDGLTGYVIRFVEPKVDAEEMTVNENLKIIDKFTICP